MKGDTRSLDCSSNGFRVGNSVSGIASLWLWIFVLFVCLFVCLCFVEVLDRSFFAKMCGKVPSTCDHF